MNKYRLFFLEVLALVLAVPAWSDGKVGFKPPLDSFEEIPETQSKQPRGIGVMAHQLTVRTNADLGKKMRNYINTGQVDALENMMQEVLRSPECASLSNEEKKQVDRCVVRGTDTGFDPFSGFVTSYEDVDPNTNENRLIPVTTIFPEKLLVVYGLEGVRSEGMGADYFPDPNRAGALYKQHKGKWLGKQVMKMFNVGYFNEKIHCPAIGRVAITARARAHFIVAIGGDQELERKFLYPLVKQLTEEVPNSPVQVSKWVSNMKNKLFSRESGVLVPEKWTENFDKVGGQLFTDWIMFAPDDIKYYQGLAYDKKWQALLEEFPSAFKGNKSTSVVPNKGKLIKKIREIYNSCSQNMKAMNDGLCQAIKENASTYGYWRVNAQEIKSQVNNRLKRRK